MRGWLAAIAALGALLGAVPAQAQPTTPAPRRLDRTLTRALRSAGGQSGALVVDMTTGDTLFSSAATTPRLPASLEKIYTTSTALVRFGPNGRLQTQVLGVGSMDAQGVWHGTLYLKGGGDPTFGSQSFDHAAYRSGATMQQLVSNLVRATGLKGLQGAIVGDESYFDSRRGTPPYGYGVSMLVEGQLSALAYDRGFSSPLETSFQRRPALFATKRFVAALRAAGVSIRRGTLVYTGQTPSDATPLAAVRSPRVAWIVHLTNTPSDNYLAEMLLKGIGAAFGGAGTTAAGAAVVRAEVQTSFGITPTIVDGSGLSRQDDTSPQQVVTALERLATNSAFVDSLAIGGETGTLQHEMVRTAAQRNCIGKTGTLSDVANLAGYCTARDGHKLVFAFLMNGLGDPAYGHLLEADMAVALAKYDG